jgi:hypothetical protein
MGLSVFGDVARGGLVVTDVSGKHTGPIFKGQIFQDESGEQVNEVTLISLLH